MNFFRPVVLLKIRPIYVLWIRCSVNVYMLTSYRSRRAASAKFIEKSHENTSLVFCCKNLLFSLVFKCQKDKL